MKELNESQMDAIVGGSLSACIGAATFGGLTILAALSPATVAIGWGTAVTALTFLSDCG